MVRVMNDVKVSAWTSAGAFVVSTKPIQFYGISFYGSAAATTIVIHDGTSTAGRTVATFPIAITSGGFQISPVALRCTGGIVATNIGTVAGYAIIYK